MTPLTLEKGSIPILPNVPHNPTHLGSDKTNKVPASCKTSYHIPGKTDVHTTFADWRRKDCFFTSTHYIDRRNERSKRHKRTNTKEALYYRRKTDDSYTLTLTYDSYKRLSLLHSTTQHLRQTEISGDTDRDIDTDTNSYRDSTHTHSTNTAQTQHKHYTCEYKWGDILVVQCNDHEVAKDDRRRRQQQQCQGQCHKW